MSAEPRLVLGTAGHIDHGKTSLIKALTGIDCDRLPEERERGITIELGFAPLTLPSGRRLGVVDVPGHERLVRTMVAGATGIDLVLFVVAADEGIMPQSREHLAICELLGVDHGVVALTKIDAVDAELAELARLDVEEQLAATSLAGAPVVPVSARSGAGLGELCAALERIAGEAAPRSARDGPAWLPVDRVFTMKGFGTVVTGTLRGAAFEEGAPVEVWPERPGEPFPARIRGLQVHGEPTAKALPGSRCAINLQGVELAAVPRGSLVASPGRLAYRRRVDTELVMLGHAPKLESGSRWTVHLGTTERSARIRTLGREALGPGERGFAELRFDVPLAVLEGERFIVRGFSRLPDAGWTVGGGRVLDAAPQAGRRPLAERLADLEAMAQGAPDLALAARLRRAREPGLTEAELLRQVLSLEGIAGVRAGSDRWIDASAFDGLVDACVAAVAEHHRAQPEDPGAGLAAVETRLARRIPEEVLRAALEAAVERGELVPGASGYCTPGHSAHAADPELARRALERLAQAGLAPEALEPLAKSLGCDAAALRPVADHLVREGRLVRVAPGLYFARGPIDGLRERVTSYLREHGEIDPPTYKTLTGQTRKFTVPLMEFFDTEKLTVRRGNLRVLRG